LRGQANRLVLVALLAQAAEVRLYQPHGMGLNPLLIVHIVLESSGFHESRLSLLQRQILKLSAAQSMPVGYLPLLVTLMKDTHLQELHRLSLKHPTLFIPFVSELSPNTIYMKKGVNYIL
jgi:hypothetical protein